MDLRHLRYFIAVAEELHFTRAAERLHIAQPPLSKQIRQLEAEIGVTLLQRTNRHIELTDAGRVFLEKAKQILAATSSAVTETQRTQRGEIGKLAVGFFEHTSYTLLPPILRAYRQRYPTVEVQLRWFPVVEQVNALLRGDIDISFVRPVSEFDGIASETILKEPFVLALPSDHPLAEVDAVDLRLCAEERYIIYNQRLAPDFYAMISRLCAVAGFVPQIALEVGQVYTTLGLVSSGAGIAFVPESVQRVRFENVTYKPLKGRQPEIEVLLAWKQSNPSTLLTAFLDTAKRAVGAAFPEKTAATKPAPRP
jgi:DNA-binding transcriptional LysR family regulator